MIERAFDVDIGASVAAAWYGGWPHCRDAWLTELVVGGLRVTLIKIKTGQRYTVALGPKGKLLFYKEKT